MISWGKVRGVLPTILLTIISLILIVSSIILSAQAAEPSQLQLQAAPMREPPQQPPPVIGGHGTGFIPPPMNLSHLTGQAMPQRLMAQQPPPSSWDWRTSGNVTPVRNQGACGSCYAFASIANIESKMLIDGAGTCNFSENNAKECNWEEQNDYVDEWGNPWGGCDGGNYQMMATLFSLKGTVLESCDPYTESDVSCNTTCPYQKTLLDWCLISANVTPDTDLLKSYIYNYGPVYASMYAGFPGFDSYNGTYTLCYEGTESPNHAVLIVGWDDSLESDCGSGGWIVKNSWGTGWGGTCGYGTEGGYFTIAYGSASIGMWSSFMHEWQDYDNDGGIMYYDDAGMNNAWGYNGQTTAWGLCKFIPTSNTSVTRVEFWTTDRTTDIDVYIYDDFDGTNLTNQLWSSLNHSFTEAGYHGVEVNSPLLVTTGDDVIAVVKFTNFSSGYPVAADYRGPNETGKTYIDLDGIGPWTDLGAHDADVAIRLRTCKLPPTVTTDNVTSKGATWATLSGNLTDLGTAFSVNASFEWGLSTGNYTDNTTPEVMSAPGTFNFNLSSLSDNTTYYFRAKAVGDGTDYGLEKSFTTLIPAPPAVTTGNVTSKGATWAILSGNLTDLGTAFSVNASFEWGLSTGNYTDNTTPEVMSAPGTFNFNLSSLSDNTTYYFRAKAVGDGTDYGLEESFTTLIPAPPAVTTGNVTSKSTTWATLSGNLTDLGTAFSVNASFEWGLSTGNYTDNTTPQAMSAPGTFNFNLSSLNRNTTYYFRAKAVGDNTSYGNEESFTTLRGGGGGGGGGGAPTYYLKTNLLGEKESFRIRDTGELQKTVDIASADGILTINIPKGTVAKDKDDNWLSSLEVTVAEDPPTPPENAHIIGLAYNFAPDGATFDPPMTLTWSYNPDALPQGVNEEELVLAYYDEDAGEWIKLDCIVDLLTHTITAEVSHLTAFAVLGFEPVPAALAVSNLSISPSKVNIGEIVTISISVANSGELAGSCKVTLKVDNMVVDTKEVTVSGGASQPVSFTISKDTAGTYSVDVNGLTGSFIVEEVAPTPVPQPAPPAPKGIDWWLIGSIAAAAVLIGLVSYFLVGKRGSWAAEAGHETEQTRG